MTKFFIYPLLLLSLISSKDRYQIPSEYEFHFADSSTITISEESELNLVEIDSQITSGKKILVNAVIKFKTGEILHLEQKDKKWKSIQLEYKKQTINIPKSVLKKIGLIHFSHIEYVWHRDSEIPFNAVYSSISFPVGNTKIFDELPEVGLCFQKGEFEEAVVKKYVEKNAYKYFDLK